MIKPSEFVYEFNIFTIRTDFLSIADFHWIFVKKWFKYISFGTNPFLIYTFRKVDLGMTIRAYVEIKRRVPDDDFELYMLRTGYGFEDKILDLQLEYITKGIPRGYRLEYSPDFDDSRKMLNTFLEETYPNEQIYWVGVPEIELKTCAPNLFIPQFIIEKNLFQNLKGNFCLPKGFIDKLSFSESNSLLSLLKNKRWVGISTEKSSFINHIQTLPGFYKCTEDYMVKYKYLILRQSEIFFTYELFAEYLCDIVSLEIAHYGNKPYKFFFFEPAFETYKRFSNKSQIYKNWKFNWPHVNELFCYCLCYSITGLRLAFNKKLTVLDLYNLISDVKYYHLDEAILNFQNNLDKQKSLRKIRFMLPIYKKKTESPTE